MRLITTTCLLLISAATVSEPAYAQHKVEKLQSLCPFGYVDSFNGYCVSPIYYKVSPTNGEACESGWMNIGGGYCKKKEFGIF